MLCTFLFSYFHFRVVDDDYVVERSGVRISSSSIIGEGHFGNVYKGIFIDKNNREIPVAVKACKEGADRSTTEKFLEEACERVLTRSKKFNMKC